MNNEHIDVMLQNMTLAEITSRYFEVNAATQESIGMDGLEPSALIAVVEKGEQKLYQRLQATEALAHDYRLKLSDVVSGTAIGQLETDLAYYKAMVAAVPEYIKDHAEGDEESLEEWFERTMIEDCE